MKFMSSYVIAKKNTIPYQGKVSKKNKSKYEKMDLEMIKQLKYFFNQYNLFSFWDKWEKIFEFSYLNSDNFNLTDELIQIIIKGINELVLTEALPKRKLNQITSKLKKSLLFDLQYSLAATFALKPLRAGLNNDIAKKSNKISPKIRKTNLINHNLVGLPLANYLSKFDNSKIDLYNMNENEISKINGNFNSFDSFKLKYSPRFIHLNEYMLCRNLIDIEHINDSNFAQTIQNEYLSIIKNENKFYDVQLLTVLNGYDITKIKMNFSYDKENRANFSIALGNIDLSTHKMVIQNHINLKNQKLIEYKENLFNLLNECSWIKTHKLKINGETKFKFTNQEKVDFLVFPELFVPFEWLNDLMFFSRKTGVGIITGVKYCETKNKLINSIANIIPFKDENGYTYSSIFLREKNDYAPDEKELIIASNYQDPTKINSFNYIFCLNDISYSIFNCYELTDIKSRALMKSQVDIIFAPQCNRDVSYFSNIIESTSRDNGCFVVQVNTSNYGDTRIVAPYDKNLSNIASITGGEKDTIHIGKINLEEYRAYKNYEKTNEFLDDIKMKYKKNKDRNSRFKKYKKSSARI